MKGFTLYFLYTILVLLVSLYIFLLKNNKNFSKNKLLPGNIRWQVLGKNIEFATSGPRKFIEERMNKYSSQVFETSFLGETIVVFCGPARNKFLFSNENKILTSCLSRSMRKVLLFSSYVDNSLKEVDVIQRSFLHEILKHEALKQYILVMDALARHHLETEWASFKEVQVYDLEKHYTLALACRLFMNIEDPLHVKILSDPFGCVMKELFSILLDFPGITYNRAIKDRKIIRGQLLKIVRNQ
ncbi:hypothetical protein ACH5RR_026203 [Cinchona calisaya]|uniref:Cytochrome P450 n=1 Tax=Cinchona calisaya TaxID=153742 RepID=A0ABD2Z1W2_9GENT